MLPFLSRICVCGALWNSFSSNGYFQTQDPPGFPYLVVGTITNALEHLAPRTYNYKEELALT